MHVQLCQSIVCYNHYLAKEYHKENINNAYCFVVVVFSFNLSSCRELLLWHWNPFTLYAKFKNWTLLSVASVLEFNKNSIVFRLARHLCSSTPLVNFVYQMNLLTCNHLNIFLLVKWFFLYFPHWFTYLESSSFVFLIDSPT